MENSDQGSSTTTPLMQSTQSNSSASEALRQASLLRMQRKQNQPQQDFSQQQQQPERQQYQQQEAAAPSQLTSMEQPVAHPQAATLPSQGYSEPNYSINNARNDDHFHRVPNYSPPSEPAVSPFGQNDSRPEWQQLGFQSEEQYRAAVQDARRQEYQQQAAQPAEQRDANPLDWAFGGQFGGGDQANGNANQAENGNRENAGGEPDEPMGHRGFQAPPPRHNGHQMSSQELHKKKNKYEMLKLGCMATCIMINMLAVPAVNKGCDFQSTKFNAFFFYLVVIPETILRILFQYLWISADSELNQRRNFLVKATTGVLYAAWSIYCLRTFESFTPHCYDPYPSYSLFIFSVVVCFILPQAFIVMCVVTILIIFSPCIIYSLCTHYRERTQQRRTRQNVIEYTPKVKYDSRRFWGIYQCSICQENFQDGDEVTPLRCDMRHTFHSPCILPWFGTEVDREIKCPLCKCTITPEDMRVQQQEIDTILDERGRKYDAKKQAEAENQV